VVRKATIHKIKVILEKTDTGFSAFASDLPVYTTGRSIAELQQNMTEALELYFEEEKKPSALLEINYEMDLQQFFLYYRVLNTKFLAERIGMNPALISQYVQGRKKPSKLQSTKILNGIQQIGKELSDLSFL
jgi:predicted RNase H-like HicB family nuclease